MVSDAVHLDSQIANQTIKNEKEEEDEDNISISTTSTDECHQDGAVVLQDTEDRVPYFGNIEVKNSSDVHFGNKTYYQGPVTIKQILYSNRDGDRSVESNGVPPQLAIDDHKCVVDAVNDDSGYRIDSVHHTNGHAKTPNGTSNVTRGRKWQEFVNKKALIITGIVMAVVLIVTIGLIVGLAVGPARQFAHTTPNPMLTDPEAPDADWGDNSVLAPGLHLNDRNEWLARPPKAPGDRLPTPVPYVIIHHTATENCSTLAKCKLVVQSVQTFHMESNDWDDIGYNFLVGGDGYAYEGRGWTTLGAHARGFNNRSIGIAFIGTFSYVLPPQRQIDQAFELMKFGVENGYIRKDYKLLGMNQVSTFESPGARFIKEIKKWPHWSPKP